MGQSRISGLLIVGLCACSGPLPERHEAETNVGSISEPLGQALAVTPFQPIFRDTASSLPFQWAGRVVAGSVDSSNENIAIADMAAGTAAALADRVLAEAS